MAARVRNPIVVQGPDGKPLAGASVKTKTRPGGVDAAVFAAETGGSAGANPATTDAHGRVVQWVERDNYVSTVSAEGMTTYNEEWDAAPAGDGELDSAWLDPALATIIQTATTATKGTIEARPAPGNFRAVYFASDLHIYFIDNGTTWDVLWPSLPTGVPTGLEPKGGEMVEMGGGGALSLPPPGTSLNRSIGVAHATGGGEVTVNCPTGEIWTVGKSLKLVPGEVVVLHSDGGNWIVRSWRRRTSSGLIVPRAEVTLGEEHVNPFPYRDADAVCDVQIVPQNGFGINVDFFVGAAPMAQLFVPEGVGNGKGLRLSTTLPLAPNEKWHATPGGTGGGAKAESLHVSYRARA